MLSVVVDRYTLNNRWGIFCIPKSSVLRSPCFLRLQYYFIDPVFELWDPHIHARDIWFATSHAPRYDTSHYPAIVGSLYNHGSTRVTLYKSTKYFIYCSSRTDVKKTRCMIYLVSMLLWRYLLCTHRNHLSNPHR